MSDLEQPDYVLTTPSVPLEGYRDSYGNWCNRLVAPSGTFSLRTETVVRDSGQTDPVDFGAEQHPVQNLPADLPALAQTTAPNASPASTGGSSSWLWIIVLLAVIAAAA